MEYKIFFEKPDDFHSTKGGAGCYCEWDGKLLFIKRSVHVPQGNTWGIPGGKLEPGESAHDAAVRELKEEVGIEVEGKLEEFVKTYVRLPFMEYTFHVFRKRFDSCPPVLLNLNECQEARWMTVAEAKMLPLIAGGSETLDYYLNSK